MTILTHPADAEQLADGDRATTHDGRQLRADNPVPATLAAPAVRPIWITVEAERLDEGLPVMWRLFPTGHLRVAWDPKQTTYDGARAIIAIEYGPEALQSVPATEPTPAQARAMAGLSRIIWESDDPQAAAREVLDVINASRLAQLLAEHHITQVPADQAAVTEPTFVSARGRRFLTVPADANPAETLEFVRQVFTAEAGE